jgi:quinol monooxygenase YgiN
MTVMITVDVKNQTPENYDAMLKFLAGYARTAPGFILHSAFAAADGSWRVVEMWESTEHANQFFRDHVVPNLPPGVRPKRHVQELHSLVTRYNGPVKQEC